MDLLKQRQMTVNITDGVDARIDRRQRRWAVFPYRVRRVAH